MRWQNWLAQILVDNAGKPPAAPSSLETGEALFDMIMRDAGGDGGHVIGK
jgi:hypothetical protein